MMSIIYTLLSWGLLLFDLVKRLFKEREVFNQTSHRGLQDLDDALALSYLFLRADQLFSSGLWGRTISKNVVLNYPDKKDVWNRLPSIQAHGSVTHAAFALKGLLALQETIKYDVPLDPVPILNHLHTIQMDNGLFHPSPDRLSAGSGGEYRHNTTALILLAYISRLSRRTNIKCTANFWAGSALREATSIPDNQFWYCDPKYETTLLYTLWCLQLYASDKRIPNELRPPGERFRNGLSTFLKTYYSNGVFFEKTHQSSRYYYSLLALEILLNIECFLDNPEWEDKAWDTICKVAKARGKNMGVPLGEHARYRCYSFQDVGTTARFYNVLSLYLEHKKHIAAERKDKAETYRHESLNFIRDAFLSLGYGQYNAMTHSFESVVSMTPFLYKSNMITNRSGLGDRFSRIESTLDAWYQEGMVKPFDLLKCDIPHSRFATLLTRRDLVRKPVVRRWRLFSSGWWLKI